MPGAAVGGGEDEPLVDEGSSTDPPGVSPLSPPHQSQEGELTQVGGLASKDEGEGRSGQAAVLPVQGRKVAGTGGEPRLCCVVLLDITADLPVFLITHQRSQFPQQSRSLLTVGAQLVKFPSQG